MSISIGNVVILTVGLVDLGGIFIWIGVNLYFAYTRLDELLERLKNCSAIMSRAPLRYGRPWGKFFLMGGISGIVTFPNFYLKRGGLSIADLDNLPASLKRRLAVLQWAAIVLIAVIFGLAIYGKLRR